MDGYTWWEVSKGSNLAQGWVAEALDDPPPTATPSTPDKDVPHSTPNLGKKIAPWSVLGGVANYGCARSGAHLHFMVINNSGRQSLADDGPVRLNGEVIFAASEGPVYSPLNDGTTNRRLAFSSMPRAGIRGDLNADGKVNALDLQLEVNVILATQTEPTIVSRADLNRDGAPNALDLQLLVNIILGI